MIKPLEKLKRIRSWDELRTRGAQAATAFREQLRVPQLPTDDELMAFIDKTHFGSTPIIAESIWQRFFKNGEKSFFPSMQNASLIGPRFREIVGDNAAEKFIGAAAGILEGRIDLLGYSAIEIGLDIDWHREPLSGKHSPLKHWKEFDELGSDEVGNKKVIWELNRHQHFFTLGVAYVLTNDERFGDAFARHLDSWMDQNPPAMGINWSSSLEAAFRSMSWLWAFHLFRDCDAFTPELFKRALKFLYLHGRHIEQYLSTYYSPNTHLTGEAIALYYLGTQLRVLNCAEDWRRLGEDILFNEITKQVHPDGVYFEQSTWYQRYTADIYAHFVTLRSLDRDANADLRTPELSGRLEKCFENMLHVTSPDGSTPLIGDDDGGRLLPLTFASSDDFRGTLALGASIFERRDMKFVAGDASDGEMFWLLGENAVRAYRSMLTEEPDAASLGFVDGGYFTMRDGWDKTDNTLLVDCGEVGSLAGGHGHADTLAIAVSIHGRQVLVDSGTYTYHDPSEMRNRFRLTNAHNTLVVDGQPSSEPGSSFGWRTKANASLDTWISEGRFDLFSGSHDGYCRLSDPVIHRREILFLKNDYWIIRDIAEAKETHDYTLNFHYAEDRDPSIIDDISVGDDEHRIFTFGDNGSWKSVDGEISRDHGSKTRSPVLRFDSKGTGTQEFFTFIIPSRNCEVAVSELRVQNGRAFMVEFDESYLDVFVLNDEPGKLVSTGSFETDFEHSWARFRKGETLPDEFVLVTGSRLCIAGIEVLKTGDIGHATVRRFGQDLYARTVAGPIKISLDDPK